jgi:hypothetical protein
VKYIYYVVFTNPNALYSRSDFYPLEVTLPKKISSIKDLEVLLPKARETLRIDLLERLKKEGYGNLVEELPENSYDQLGIISFSLLRKEE